MRQDILLRSNEIQAWVSANRSKAWMCQQLSCRPVTLDRYLSILGIEYRGNKSSNGYSKKALRRPATDYLDLNGPFINSHKLKTILIRDGLREHQCARCKRDTWCNHRIPLELHHKNGNRHDNRDFNLDLLCPNCHALTENHAGKALKAVS